MTGHILALSGGVGGAKLAAGLASVLPPERLSVIVNTGDDFDHLDLRICPDIDSVVYSMAGLNDPVRGWGVMGESWQAMEMLGRLGEEQWFSLGDRDLAMHLARTRRLGQGESLSDVTHALSGALGIRALVAPMSDDIVRTQILADTDWIDFQTYFVKEQCRPVAREIRFDGAEQAAMSAALNNALSRPDLAAIVICPSNPLLSIDPILALPGVRKAITARRVPCVAVSPLIGGTAVKGPLAKLFSELGYHDGNHAIALHYRGLIDRIVIDNQDADDAQGLQDSGVCVTLAQTIMRDSKDKEQLARVVLRSVGVD